MTFSLWLVFALAYLGITFSPGPNVLIVLTHAAKYGFKNIYVAIAGNLTCQLIIIAAVGMGVSTLLTTESIAYHWMKYAGAFYLAYLGLRIIHDVFVRRRLKQLKAPTGAGQAKVLPSVTRRYLEAFTVSASNPKTVIFLSAFLPQFVAPERAVFPQFVVMYLTIAGIVIAIHSVYALLLIKMKSRFSGSMSSRFFPGLTAAIYLFLGASLGWSA